MFELKGSAPEPQVCHAFGNYTSSSTNWTYLFWEKWSRRAITVSIYTAFFLFYLVLSPVLFFIAVVCDVFVLKNTKHWPCIRIVLFFLLYLLNEMAAVYIFGAGLYLVSTLLFFNHDTWKRCNYAAQHYWGGKMHFKAAMAVLGGHLEVEGLDLIDEGAYVMFMRHTSFADTLLPQGLLSHCYRLRYILKKELLWDIGLDVLGSRTPNYFVARGTRNVEALNALASLLSDYQRGANIITCIWPEGTRFTKKRQSALLARLKEKAEQEQKSKEEGTPSEGEGEVFSPAELYERAQQFKKTLPPRLGGALKLLEENDKSKCDVLFCAHIGMEKANTFWDLLNADFASSNIRVRFFKVNYSDIPPNGRKRAEWLFEWWKKVDDWVVEQSEKSQGKKEK